MEKETAKQVELSAGNLSTDQQLEADRKMQQEAKERKGYMNALVYDLEVMRLEAEHLRLRKEIIELRNWHHELDKKIEEFKKIQVSESDTTEKEGE